MFILRKIALHAFPIFSKLQQSIVVAKPNVSANTTYIPRAKPLTQAGIGSSRPREFLNYCS
jgi:hypothetical protein